MGTETGKLAATVRREVGIRDHYAVSVEDGEDIVACILCFALIDGVYHSNDSGEAALIDNTIPAFVKGKDPCLSQRKYRAKTKRKCVILFDGLHFSLVIFIFFLVLDYVVLENLYQRFQVLNRFIDFFFIVLDQRTIPSSIYSFIIISR